MATPGWIPQLRWDRLWRLSKASVDSPGDRQFAARDLLHSWLKPAPGWGNPQEWKIYAAAVLSSTALCTVGDISSLRRSNISKAGITFQGVKPDQREVTHRLGPYARALAWWLRRIAPGEAPAVGRAAFLEMGMAQLLEGSERCSARWHSWRRAGATYLRWLGLPWRHLLWWGRWRNIKVAHLYVSPPDDFECLHVARLPWLADEGIRWRKTHVRDLWLPVSPNSLTAAGERVLYDGVKPPRSGPSAGSGGPNGGPRGPKVVENPVEQDNARRSELLWKDHGIIAKGAPTPGGHEVRGPGAGATGRRRFISGGPIDVDGGEDEEMGSSDRLGPTCPSRTVAGEQGGGRFQGRPRGFTTWRTRRRATTRLGAQHLTCGPGRR